MTAQLLSSAPGASRVRSLLAALSQAAVAAMALGVSVLLLVDSEEAFLAYAQLTSLPLLVLTSFEQGFSQEHVQNGLTWSEVQGRAVVCLAAWALSVLALRPDLYVVWLLGIYCLGFMLISLASAAMLRAQRFEVDATARIVIAGGVLGPLLLAVTGVLPVEPAILVIGTFGVVGSAASLVVLCVSRTRIEGIRRRAAGCCGAARSAPRPSI